MRPSMMAAVVLVVAGFAAAAQAAKCVGPSEGYLQKSKLLSDAPYKAQIKAVPAGSTWATENIIASLSCTKSGKTYVYNEVKAFLVLLSTPLYGVSPKSYVPDWFLANLAQTPLWTTATHTYSITGEEVTFLAGLTAAPGIKAPVPDWGILQTITQQVNKLTKTEDSNSPLRRALYDVVTAIAFGPIPYPLWVVQNALYTKCPIKALKDLYATKGSVDNYGLWFNQYYQCTSE